MRLPGDQIVALLVAISFAAGLNVYATVATLGLLGHYDLVTLPQQLHLLTSWWVIGASSALFGVGFFADKIPGFDLVWNTLHTFIRVPVAALLAWRATSNLSPGAQLAATFLGGVVALVAHSGKTAAHAAVTPSPEPLSNAGLSMGSDALSISLTWLATKHPIVAGAIALALILVIILFIRWVWKSLRNLLARAGHLLQFGAG
jgi:hypothetical protein